MQEDIPCNLGALLMQIPLTKGLPIMPSNRITIASLFLTETLKSTSCKGLLAPTTEKMSKSERTC